MNLYFVVRGLPHPFDHPHYGGVEIVGWASESTPLAAATAIAEQDRQHDHYTAFEWGGQGRSCVLYVPGEGVDPNPPPVVIG